MRRAHLAVYFLLRNERRDRVDNNKVDRTGANKRLGYLERLLSAVRLRNKQILNLYAEILGINRVERMLCVDKCGSAALFLNLCGDMQCERRFTGRLGTVYLDDSALRQTADSERKVESQRAGRDRRHVDGGILAELDYRACAELLGYLRYRSVKRFFFSFASVGSATATAFLGFVAICFTSLVWGRGTGTGYAGDAFEKAPPPPRKALKPGLFLAAAPTKASSSRKVSPAFQWTPHKGGTFMHEFGAYAPNITGRGNTPRIGVSFC